MKYRQVTLLSLTVAVLFLIASAPLYAGGRKEAPAESRIFTETEKDISFYLVLEDDGNSPSPTDTSPQTAGLCHLFQNVEVIDGLVRISSDRTFSLTGEEWKTMRIEAGIEVVRYEGRLAPRDPLSYRIVGQEEFSFTLDEIVSGDRVRMQPARKALLEAARKAGMSKALMRVKQIEMKADGTFSGIVEIAVTA